MIWGRKVANLILGGGGVKGIAYIGALEVAESRGIHWGSIAGVSAGALAGAFIGAGYSSQQLGYVLNTLDFEKIDIENIPKRVPAVARYMESVNNSRKYDGSDANNFLNQRYLQRWNLSGTGSGGYRNVILDNIDILSREGGLLNGDYLEEWVEKALAVRGVTCFGDLRGGIVDKVNPRGYKVRMTAVDVNRARVIILPDDIAYYGIDPDRFSVARAIRMSTSVPFAFKPVELKKKEGDSIKTHYIVDGGVLDNFPFWAVDNRLSIPTVGFMLNGNKKNTLLSLDTPLNILKTMISLVHDIGVPKNAYMTRYIAEIDTTKVGFLDFNLDEDEMNYLLNAGRHPAEILFNKLEYDMFMSMKKTRMLPLAFRLPRRRFYY